MSKKRIIQTIALHLIREFMRRKGRVTPARAHGYGHPRRGGLKGKIVDTVLRRVERKLRKVGIHLPRR